MGMAKLFKTENEQKKLLILLAAGFLLRLILAAAFEGCRTDLECFGQWAQMAAKTNLFSFYTTMHAEYRFIDYPPLYIYILYPIGKLAQLLNLTTLNWLARLLLKLPSLLTDVAITYLFYQFSKKHLPSRLSFGLAAFYLFNPLIWYNSAIWGQVDSVFTLWVVAGFLCLSAGKVSLATIPFMAAVLTKPQGIIFLPVLFFELLRQKKIRGFLSAALYAVLTCLLISLPFSFGQSPDWIIKLYLSTANQYPFASLNAANLFTLFGANFVSDSQPFLFLPYRLWGYIFITMVTLLVGFLYLRGKKEVNTASLTGLMMIFGAFVLMHRMHERYIYPAAILALLSFAYWQDKRLLRICSGLSLMGLLNMMFVPYPGNIIFPFTGDWKMLEPAGMIISLGNLFLFGYILKVSIDIMIKNQPQKFGVHDSLFREIFIFGWGKPKEVSENL
jgi:Gpi18-like mannosyltransferase